MHRPRWVNRRTVFAATALLGGGALLAPAIYRGSVNTLIDFSLQSRFAAGAVCGIDPEAESGWFDYNPDRLCYVDAPSMAVSNNAANDDPFMALAYVGSEYGATITVFGTSDSVEMPLHERAHREQGTVEQKTIADRVIFRTFRESDARLAVIIEAYRRMLSTGDRTLWRDVNSRHPEMLRVFDALLVDDKASRDSLAEGGLPSVRIMRQTAMAYLFSSSAEDYLTRHYANDYPDMAAVLASDRITITPTALANALRRDGIAYLYTEGERRQDSPLNRWVLYETLGIGLTSQERPAHDAYAAEEEELRRAIEVASIAEVPNLTAQHNAVCRRSPEVLAYEAAGLARFRGQLVFSSLAGPLPGIDLPRDTTPPPPPAPVAAPTTAQTTAPAAAIAPARREPPQPAATVPARQQSHC